MRPSIPHASFTLAAELSQTLPDDTADLVLAVAHRYLLLVLVRQNGTTTWVQQRPPQGDARTQEYALCRMLYTMLMRCYRYPPALGHDDRRTPGAHHP